MYWSSVYIVYLYIEYCLLFSAGYLFLFLKFECGPNLIESDIMIVYAIYIDRKKSQTITYYWLWFVVVIANVNMEKTQLELNLSLGICWEEDELDYKWFIDKI